MDVETVWRHIHAERRTLAETLAALDDDQWRVPSTCPGWTVQDVAAHVISSPQYRKRDFPGIVWRGRFDLNRAILLEGQRLGRASTAEILDQYERFSSSFGLAPTTTPLEPLIDVLVHTQDIARPLGLRVAAPPDAALVGTERALRQSKIFGRPDLDAVRLEASDIEWSRGTGPVVRAPMQEILMLATGRAADSSLLDGDGAGLVRTT